MLMCFFTTNLMIHTVIYLTCTSHKGYLVNCDEVCVLVRYKIHVNLNEDLNLRKYSLGCATHFESLPINIALFYMNQPDQTICFLYYCTMFYFF